MRYIAEFDDSNNMCVSMHVHAYIMCGAKIHSDPVKKEKKVSVFVCSAFISIVNMYIMFVVQVYTPSAYTYQNSHCDTIPGFF